MKVGKTAKTIIIIIICFSMYLYFRDYFKAIKTWLDPITNFGLLSYFLTYVILGIPLFIGTYLINFNKNIWKDLGLSLNIIKPFVYALLFAIPMLLGGIIFFDFNADINTQNILAGSIVIGFIEELFFRGFLFGQLFKNTKLGFIPAIFFGALVFAMGHLYQSQDIFELFGIFTVTFMGAVLFAWLYVEWNYNLWIPIFLHALMNLSWNLFAMDETALGGLLPNILRGLTITLAIGFTIIYKRKRNMDMAITKNTLFTSLSISK
ncbi:CPBP family intramembrane metalloprotease [Flavobacteriaceae bacterium S0825]|uniref:CPBP family intramembrane glutamic endopeptidase n=1 Tax=Gaetbulibacter sp. S0825 TaxID=2720084 RepID=UPI0014314B6F|nr:type II CAAX endopeptidase family protein [Gaetbulibacter sp. S0825]MCK0109939.1 CPBP family intramembrane metalloprotease [Flavobacteriaceae bacterium S0825]NIX65568.1 CPBP family intramembrane metalloprotease [Gaetbulibacter sp. S0825]